MKITIKEKSGIARLAAMFLKEDNMAIVIGKTIHLWNASRHDLLKNKKWLQHELIHVQQFKRYGFIRFILLYIFESLRNGYNNNKYEIEARVKENDRTIANIDFN